tara:strand:- start:4924 stop:5757 length:834 start_codon:yes stop_codon:yes gene_type:complete
MRTSSITGLCRFSFVGRGDWTAYRGPDVDHNDATLRSEIAEKLYESNRMAKRFFVFENLLLPSLDNQSDSDFQLIVLTSKIMPLEYKERLLEICQYRKYITVLFSDATDVNSGLVEEIQKIQSQSKAQPVQFRIDDDDGLASDYIERLRRATVAMADYPNFAYSRPSGVVATLYRDQGPKFYKVNQPFHAAGCACRLNRLGMTIFSYGHFALGDRFPALVDNSGIGHLAIKLEDHDSEHLNGSDRARRGHKEISLENFSANLEKKFSFINWGLLSSM